MTVKVEAQGLETLQQALARFPKFSRDFRTKLPRVIFKAQKKRIRERIKTKKHGPDGESWDAWSENYAKTRSGGNSLLVGDRKLLNSFRVVMSTGKGQLGSSLPYAAAQHFGVKTRGLEPRPYFGLGKEDVTHLDDVIHKWVKDAWP